MNIQLIQNILKSKINTTGKIAKHSLVLLLAVASTQAAAHSRWLVPTHTILSGEETEVVAIDLSISNDIFHPDFALGGVPLKDVALLLAGEKLAKKPTPKDPGAAFRQQLAQSTKLEVVQPNGEITHSEALINFGRKSTTAIELAQSGTYRVGVVQNPIYFTLFKDAEGNRGREFGKLEQVKASLPKGATDISVMKVNNRVETYITRNDLNTTALAVTGNGLELVFSGHPNELFVKEKHTIQLLANGKPVAEGTEVKLTREGTRHRNDRELIIATTDSKGFFELVIDKAGFYLLEVEIKVDATEKGVNTERLGLYTTLEVNAE